jgi:hypothetical protein
MDRDPIVIKQLLRWAMVSGMGVSYTQRSGDACMSPWDRPLCGDELHAKGTRLTDRPKAKSLPRRIEIE